MCYKKVVLLLIVWIFLKIKKVNGLDCSLSYEYYDPGPEMIRSCVTICNASADMKSCKELCKEYYNCLSIQQNKAEHNVDLSNNTNKTPTMNQQHWRVGFFINTVLLIVSISMIIILLWLHRKLEKKYEHLKGLDRMPRQLIVGKGSRSLRSFRRPTTARKHRTIIPQEAEGILGSDAVSITGPTTTLDYLKVVKSIFLYEPSVYRKFVNVMTDYQKQNIDIVEVLKSVVILFDGYPNLIRDFNVFLPDGYSLEIQEDAVVVKEYEATNNDRPQTAQSNRENNDDTLQYISKVKETFKSNPEKYAKFTRILNEYHQKKAGEVSTVQRVVALLRHYPILVLHFNKFLPDGHEIHMFDNSSYTIEFPVEDGRKAISIKA